MPYSINSLGNILTKLNRITAGWSERHIVYRWMLWICKEDILVHSSQHFPTWHPVNIFKKVFRSSLENIYLNSSTVRIRVHCLLSFQWSSYWAILSCIKCREKRNHFIENFILISRKEFKGWAQFPPKAHIL